MTATTEPLNKSRMAAMIGWAKVGPGTARVDDIVIREGSGSYASFSRLDTA